MRLVVCDTEPCASLGATIESLAVIPKGEQKFNLTVIAKGKTVKTYYFPLSYCPFCGTRIEPEWVSSYLSAAAAKRNA